MVACWLWSRSHLAHSPDRRRTLQRNRVVLRRVPSPTRGSVHFGDAAVWSYLRDPGAWHEVLTFPSKTLGAVSGLVHSLASQPTLSPIENEAGPRVATAGDPGGTGAVRMLKRAQILLAADAGSKDEAIAQNVGVGTSTVYRIKQRFVENGLERALHESPRPVTVGTPTSAAAALSTAAAGTGARAACRRPVLDHIEHRAGTRGLLPGMRVGMPSCVDASARMSDLL